MREEHGGLKELRFVQTVVVVFSFILDVRLVDAPAGVTQDFSTFLLRCLL